MTHTPDPLVAVIQAIVNELVDIKHALELIRVELIGLGGRR